MAMRQAASIEMSLVVDLSARAGRFPQEEHCQCMLDGDAEPFAKWASDGASGRGRQAHIHSM